MSLAAGRCEVFLKVGREIVPPVGPMKILRLFEILTFSMDFSRLQKNLVNYYCSFPVNGRFYWQSSADLNTNKSR